ncbi:MAG: TetR/AcrR family transcriptional regulator [Mycobacterium sp.]
MGRQRQFDERQAVKSAQDQFWRHGYAGTSLRDLIAATGVSRGSLYAAFGDKHSLFMRALDSYCAMSLRRAAQELGGEPPSTAYDGIVNHVRCVADRRAADTERRGGFLAKCAAELIPADEEATARITATFELYRRALTVSIVRAQREHDLDPRADPDALAGFILGGLYGLEALHKLGESGSTVHATAEQLIAVLPASAGWTDRRP